MTDAAPASATVELSAKQLADAMLRVRPFAGTDDTLPSVTGVRFYTRRDGRLCASATNRYVAGMVVITLDDDAPPPDPAFDIVIPPHDLSRILGLFKPQRGMGGAPYLRFTQSTEGTTVEECAPVFGMPTTRIAFRKFDVVAPDLDAIFTSMIAKRDDAAPSFDPVGYNPGFLALFQHVVTDRSAPITFHASGPGVGTLATTTDGDFIGAIMPVKVPIAAADERLATWRAALAPVEVRAPRKRAPRSKGAAA